MKRVYGVGMRVALAAVLLAGVVAPVWAGPEEDGNAGLDALKAGEYGRAVQLFTRAIASGKLAPDDREFAYVQRGTAYLNLHNKAAAVADFEHALKINPNDADAQQGLADARAGGGAHAGRGAGGVNALELAKQGSQALDSGDYPAAIALFGRAISSGRLSPDDTELAYMSRGRAYLKQGDVRAAVQDLATALQRKPDDADAQQAFGEALNKLPPPSPPIGIDAKACKAAMTTSGNAITGKSFSSHVDYPGLGKLDAFAGLYRAVNRHSPAFGANWTVTAANLQTGVLTAEVTPPGSDAQVKLDARVDGNPSGARVTMTEEMTGAILIIDIRGSMCKSLNDIGH